jgi:enamine deaminase RidA (YjgF/YER057c/UK114 family)
VWEEAFSVPGEPKYHGTRVLQHILGQTKITQHIRQCTNHFKVLLDTTLGLPTDLASAGLVLQTAAIKLEG